VNAKFLSGDFLGGLLFLAVGAFVMVAVSGYPMGTAMRMGPGYFPMLIGGMIAGLGLILAVRAVLAAVPGERVSGFAFQPLLFILGGIAVFALLIERTGLIIAVSALVLIARMSRIEGRALELVALAVALSAMAYAVFVFGLKMPLKVVPW
jgi:hypothetical protein